MTTYYVSPTGSANNNGLTAGAPKTVTSALAAAGSGDIISFNAGDYPRVIIENKTIGLVSTTLPTPTIIPGWASPHPARTTKNVHIDTLVLRNSPNCTFFDLDIVLKQWIDTTDGTHVNRNGSWHTGFGANDPGGIIGQDETSHRPIFTGCEVRWGYGPSQAPFDPTVKYPEFQSGAWASSAHNATGHGDSYQTWWKVDNVLTGEPGYTPATTTLPNGRAYNTIVESPYGFSGRSEADAPEFRACYFHDLSKGIVASTNRGRLVIDQCWFDRVYGIVIQLACDSLTLSDGFQVTRNLCTGIFNNSSDSGNPHGDYLQHFVYIVDADPNKVLRIPRVWIERNFWISRPTDRGFAQFMYLQGGRTGSNRTVYVNPIIRDNLGLQKGNNLGLDPVIEDGVISNNMAVGVPGSAQPSSATIGARKNEKDGFAGVVIMEDNIAEAMGSGSYLKSTGNISTGQGYSSISTSNLYTGSFPPSDDSLPGWYAAITRKGSYASKGPRFATLYNALTDTLSTANLKVFVGWASKSLMPKGQLVVASPSAIRGPAGDNVTVSVDIGQFRVINPAGTVVTDWTSTATVAAVGNRLIPRHTTATSFGGLVTQNVTLTHATQGASTFQFKSTTLSNTVFPKVGLAKTPVQIIARGALGADTKKAMMAIMFRMPEVTGNTNAYLVGHLDTQTGFRARILTAGAGNILRISAWNSDGTTSIFNTNINSGELNLTSDYLFIYSLDTALGTAGFSAAIWDMTLGGNPITFNAPPTVADVTIGFSNTTGASAQRVLNSGANGPGCHLSFYMLKLNAWLDATDPENVRKLMAAFIGGNAQGVFGTAPEVFLTGSAADYNTVGGFNRGTSALKFAIESGAATDVSTAPWPPKLDLLAEVISPTPFVIDKDVTVQITPAGYAEPGSSISLKTSSKGDFSNENVTLPEGSGGVTVIYAPRVSGDHTITGIHSGGYTTFTPQIMSVIDPYTYITPGANVVLTTAQLATLQIRTYEDVDITTQTPLNIRWKRSANNTGYTDGINFVVDIDLPAANAFIYKRMVEVLTSNVEFSLNMSELSALIPNGNGVTVDIPAALNNITINYTE